MRALGARIHAFAGGNAEGLYYCLVRIRSYIPTEIDQEPCRYRVEKGEDGKARRIQLFGYPVIAHIEDVEGAARSVN